MRIRALAVTAVLMLPGSAAAAPATPDATYAPTAGFAGRTATAAAVLVDGAGRAVVAARTGPAEAGLLRAGANGGLDFATITPFPGADDSLLTDVVEHAGGYAAGGWVEQAPGGRRFALLRYGSGGSLLGVTIDPHGDGEDELHGLAAAPDGRLVAAGRSGDLVAVARYSATGVPDGSFPRVHDFAGVTGEEAGAVLVEPDGRIIVAGTARTAEERRVLVAALTPAGALDPAFGSGGAALLDVGDGEAAVRALARQPDGRLLVGGTTGVDGAGGGFVARLQPSGAPDTGFSTDGIARLNVAGGVVEAVAIAPDGKVLAAGAADSGLGSADGLVARFRPGGVRDPGFGTDGVARRSLPGRERLTGVGLTPDGRIVAGGLRDGAVVLTRLTGGDSSDPALSMSAEGIGDLITFTATALNRGADPARDVRVRIDPPGATALAISTPGGECAGTVCDLGTIAPGAIGRVKVLARADTAGRLAAGATVTTSTFDSDPDNNAAGATGATTAGFRPDRTRPKPVLQLPARRARQLRKGFRVRVGVNEPATVTVTARAGKKVAARGRIRLSARGRRKLGLRVTAAGRAALRKATRRKKPKKLRLTITARAVDRWDNVGTVRLRKTLRR